MQLWRKHGREKAMRMNETYSSLPWFSPHFFILSSSSLPSKFYLGLIPNIWGSLYAMNYKLVHTIQSICCSYKIAFKINLGA